MDAIYVLCCASVLSMLPMMCRISEAREPMKLRALCGSIELRLLWVVLEIGLGLGRDSLRRGGVAQGCLSARAGASFWSLPATRPIQRRSQTLIQHLHL